MVLRILISQGKQKKAYGTDAAVVSVAGQKAAQREGTVPHNYACFFFFSLLFHYWVNPNFIT